MRTMPRFRVSAGNLLPQALYVLLVSPLLSLLLAASSPADAETLSHGRFKTVEVYRPAGSVKHVALFLSGDGGWTRGLARMANTMVADGVLVIVSTFRNYTKRWKQTAPVACSRTATWRT